MKQRVFKADGVEMVDGSSDPALVGYCFLAFRKGNVIRHFALDDLEFSKAFEMVNGRCDGRYDHVY